MKYNHVIWDFNGTILDDVEIGIESINVLLKKRNLKMIENSDEYRRIFCFPVESYYRKLGIDIDSEGYDVPANEWVNEYNARRKNVSVKKEIISAIDTFSSLGIPQTVISATEKNMLKEQLSDLKIADMFSEIYGCDNIYAESKTALAVRWAKKNKCTAVMIGDTCHDFDTARAAGIDCVLVSGGHQDYERLSECGCPVFHDIQGAVEYILKTD